MKEKVIPISVIDKKIEELKAGHGIMNFRYQTEKIDGAIMVLNELKKEAIE